MGSLPNVGQTYPVWWPFKRENYTPIPDEDPAAGGTPSLSRETFTWIPGWRYEDCGPEDVEEAWDGEGTQHRTVISLHRPAQFPTRVFYVRFWRDPYGRAFGNRALRMTTVQSFNQWHRGEKWPGRSSAFRAHRAWVARLTSPIHDARPALPGARP